ncbi:zinc finger protein 62 homolog isoform X2 [Toxorhynchites rutilus septentrionalis]|uniref:zinc finger protein 62 homolog isoform X2 n=1 Tax=Toxorhynchites rutilus septentrionalis TaxID=329112 RepID=UPI002478DE26|nr:zinc finger protein 62 homolog isoform X2 [Toxorhynchites rutilus septentrionalis]
MELCRTCMNKRGSDAVGDEFISVFSILEEDNVYIADFLSRWVGCEVREDDGLPSEICSPCIDAIKSISYFFRNVEECDQQLRIMLKPLTFPLETHTDISIDSIKQESDDFMEKTEPSEFIDDKSTIELKNFNYDLKLLPVMVETTSDAPSEGESVPGQENYGSSSEKVENRGRVKTGTTCRRVKRKRIMEYSSPSMDASDDLDAKELETYDIIDTEYKIICCGCFRLFNTEEELAKHGELLHKGRESKRSGHHNQLEATCKFCYKRFDGTSQCAIHRKWFVGLEKVYECKKCKKRFVNPSLRRKHAYSHKDWNIAAPKIFPVSMSKLEKHGYLCCVRGCTSSQSSEDDLFEHIKKTHNVFEKEIDLNISGMTFQCVFCFKFFESKNKLDNHHINRYNTMVNTVQHQCHQCGKIFRSLEFLEAHENRHADLKPYECDICFKKYYSGAVLKQHRITHTQEKNLICTVCGTAFRTKAFLENHYRIHSNAKPFECDICHKTFRHSSSLFTHKKTHNPDKHMKCAECGKAFADSTNLKRHMVSHTGIKPYQCSYCEKRFMRLGERAEHESVVHYGVMPYTCDTCGAQFATKRTFQKHEQQVCGFVEMS